MAAITAPVVTAPLVTSGVVTGASVAGGQGGGGAGNTAAAVIAATNPSSYWLLDEVSGDYVDSGTGGFDLAPGNATRQNYRMPGLAQGAPRVYGTWSIAGGLGYGNLVSAASEGYDLSAWSTGGLGILCLIGNHLSLNVPIVHSSTSVTYVSIQIFSNGTIQGRFQSLNSNRVLIESAAGVYEFGKRNFLFFQQRANGVGPSVYYNGVDVTATRTYIGTGIGADSFVDDCIANSGQSGAGNSIRVGNASFGGISNNPPTAIYCFPMIFYNKVLSDGEILGIANSFGHGGPHDDLMEFMIDKVGDSKIYLPCLPSAVLAPTQPYVLTRTNGTNNDPLFQSGTVNAIDDDATFGAATVYDKKQWTLEGADSDAYLRNQGSAGTPLVEIGDPGTTGTMHLTVRVREIPVADRYYFNYDSVGDFIRWALVPGVGAEGRLTWQVQDGGVLQWEGYIEVNVDDLLALWVVQDGTGYKIYLNGTDITNTFTVGTNLDDTIWFGDIGTGIRDNEVFRWTFTDLDKIGYQYFYTETVMSAADVLEMWNAMNGSFA